MTEQTVEPLPPIPRAANLAEAIGSIVMATSAMEWQLATTVAELTHSPLTLLCVQGLRGSTLVPMARRLLARGIGSTAEDQSTGRTERLGLLGHEDTERFDALLREAERLLVKRDTVAHCIWLTVGDDGTHTGIRMKANPEQHEWSVDSLNDLRQAIVNATHDLFVESWNATARQAGMDRIEGRGEADVMG
jgi:hypothetical protein